MSDENVQAESAKPGGSAPSIEPIQVPDLSVEPPQTADLSVKPPQNSNSHQAADLSAAQAERAVADSQFSEGLGTRN